MDWLFFLPKMRYVTGKVISVRQHDSLSGRQDHGHSEENAGMALKKSELYSSLWSSCDELRGGMDASQYKDYVLVLLFIKYISDKYAGQPFAPIQIPDGASFRDLVALKGKTDIGDQINKRIVAPLASANQLSDMPDFNDPSKLGSGK
jgi:type I restriction enzyme M protein